MYACSASNIYGGQVTTHSRCYLGNATHILETGLFNLQLTNEGRLVCQCELPGSSFRFPALVFQAVEPHLVFSHGFAPMPELSFNAFMAHYQWSFLHSWMVNFNWDAITGMCTGDLVLEFRMMCMGFEVLVLIRMFAHSPRIVGKGIGWAWVLCLKQTFQLCDFDYLEQVSNWHSLITKLLRRIKVF